MRLRSQAVAALLNPCHRINEMMLCPLAFEPAGGSLEYREPGLAQVDDLSFLVAAAHHRLKRQIIDVRRLQRGARLRRIPSTPEKVKARVKMRYESDGANVLPLLCAGGSVSGPIFTQLRLTRGIVREVMTRLRYSRPLQATFASIACATQFKFF